MWDKINTIYYSKGHLSFVQDIDYIMNNNFVSYHFVTFSSRHPVSFHFSRGTEFNYAVICTRLSCVTMIHASKYI